jgi:peptide deformylase
MAIRQIRKDGDEILRKKSRIVDVVDDKIRELLDDMEETMHAANGVGISAVQVGILKRLVVIDIYDGNKPLKLVNPVIVKQKGKQEVEEGCLSFPNQFAKVVRPMEVTVKALDENGKEITIKGKELLAQALAHEIDHLDGRLFVDIMIPDTMEYIEPNNNESEPKKEKNKK